MTPLHDKIMSKLKGLSEYELREILEFVEVIVSKQGQNGHNGQDTTLENDPILALAGTLSFPPISNEDIDRELYGINPSNQED